MVWKVLSQAVKCDVSFDCSVGCGQEGQGEGLEAVAVILVRGAVKTWKPGSRV